MTADINVILQLLQRQITPVPPAYSSVSPGNHCPDPSILYGTSAPVLYNLYPIQTESRATMIQVKIFLEKVHSFGNNQINCSHIGCSPFWRDQHYALLIQKLHRP